MGLFIVFLDDRLIPAQPLTVPLPSQFALLNNIKNESTGKSMSLFCALMELDVEQQRVPLDMSEWSRKSVYKKVEKESYGDK